MATIRAYMCSSEVSEDCGKRRIYRSPAFAPFTTIFSKGFPSVSCKVRITWLNVKVRKLYHVCLSAVTKLMSELFPKQALVFTCRSTSLSKTVWGKRSNFSFSHRVFYPFGELSAIFIKFEIVVCRLFQVGTV